MEFQYYPHPIASSASKDFRKLVYDLFLQQMNMHPTRFVNILDLILTNVPESITDVSCVASELWDLSSDHNLLIFDFKVHVKQSYCNLRTVFGCSKANWEGLHKIRDFQSSSRQ